MTRPLANDLPTIDHVGFLEDLYEIPSYLIKPDYSRNQNGQGRYSCSFCGVGDSATILIQSQSTVDSPPVGYGSLTINVDGKTEKCPVRINQEGQLELEAKLPLATNGVAITGELEIENYKRIITAKEVKSLDRPDNHLQIFQIYSSNVSSTKTSFSLQTPTAGCVKMKSSMGQQKPVFPIHTAPSALNPETGQRQTVSYRDAISRFADLLLAHRPPEGRTLLYACGQTDYFTAFAMQEVFRLLGVRSLTGNAEHCLNAGAVHNEILTGQEGPYLTMEQCFNGPGRFFLLNGWNGSIGHPPAFNQVVNQKNLDAYLVETVVTESAQILAQKLGPDRILLIRSASDTHLALSVAHEILSRYPQAVEQRFIEGYSDIESYDKFVALAKTEDFSPERVAYRIAPEPSYEERLLKGIRDIASKLARPDVVPINIPSVGLSQTKGVVPHCIWGNIFAILGKFGLKADGTPAGGTLRIPGQVNAETEAQGMSRNIFMGRIRMTEEGAVDAARRMGLPDDAYEKALHDKPRAALDYGEPTQERELFICFGTQFEGNMMGRKRWIKKLESPNTTLVVIDPIPDPFTLRRAALIIPSPPHVAAAKLYQNGEWRITLSVPRKRAPEETRTDPTIIYDLMAEISHRFRNDSDLCRVHPDLTRHSESGYLRRRFESIESGGELERIDGEVSRPRLWERVQAYMSGGIGPLYCRPEREDGSPIRWEELLQSESLVYGGVGKSRYRLDYDDPNHIPFRDIYRRPGKFKFFVPTEKDLELPKGIILNSGRSTLTDDRARIRFANATFNSGKATPAVDMPDENPLFISQMLADQLGFSTGDRARVTNTETGDSIHLPVVVTNRVKGEAGYVNFHKSRAELEEGRYLNDVTSHTGRCPYCSQTNFKATTVQLERVGPDSIL
jgi:anaerobic selenocysteine-containing dehydrogenase